MMEMSIKRALIITLMILFLIGMLGVAIKVQRVKASGTIYIKADGSVDPSNAPILNVNNVSYTFTSNINDSIVVERSNIIIDGAGYVIEGNGTGRGFKLQSISNVTIKNTKIKGFEFGIYLQSASSNTIYGNNITNNDYGIYLSGSSNNNISENNIVNNNEYGIWLFSSSDNVLSKNVMNGSKYNFYVRGTESTHFIQSIDVSNFIDGKPVYYLVNQKDLSLNSATHPQVGYLGLINCYNVTVEGLTLTNNWQGLLLAYTNNSRITGNNLTSNYYGVWLFSSSDNALSENNLINNDYGIYFDSSSNYNSISRNHITNNIKSGIGLDLSSNNTFFENNITSNQVGIALSNSSSNSLFRNNITANSLYGIDLFSFSNYNNISGNSITNKDYGIILSASLHNSIFRNNITANNYDGIVLDESSNNSVSGNRITNNGMRGIYLDYSSNYNSIYENNITSNQVGIELGESSNNKLFHNNFIDNTEHVDIFMSGYANFWDDGYPSGGNYWSDYTGVDSDYDGIGDSSHEIDADNRDNYPLMGMFSSFNTSVGYTVNIISNSTIEDFEYFELNNTIRIHVSNTSSTQAFGFCRVRIPKSLMAPPYTVTIDDGLIEVLYFNDKTYDNSTHRWIYFAYEHSTRKVIIHGFPPDSTPPIISILSPENKTYDVNDISLTFTINESTSWIGYSLDGQANVTITGNTTLSGLSNGSHSLIVYANDTAGNTGASEIIYFSVDVQQTVFALSTFEWLIIGIVVVAVIVGTTGFALYKITRQDEGKNEHFLKV